jgi:hypothetical protein
VWHQTRLPCSGTNKQAVADQVRISFYSGPLRGIFSTLRRINILSDVQILVLDGLSVTADLVHDIVTDPSYSVRILSLRECTHLNERKLRGTLKYICRPTRPEATPKLKGLYFFNKKEPSASRPGKTPATGVAPSGLRPGIAVAATWNARSQEALAPTTLVVDEAAPEPWYGLRGPQSRGFRPIDRDWAQTLVDCDGIIAFDAVLCAGPRHMNSRAWGQVDIAALEAASSSAVASVPTWAFAQYSLDGCAGCGSAPEGWTAWGADEVSDSSRPDNTGRRYSDGGCKDSGIGRYPLLSPPPRHSASVKAAMCPAGQALYTRPSSATSGTAQAARFIPRCISCLRDRYCTSCHKWWCESCYLGPYPQGSTAANAQGVHQDAEMVSTISTNAIVKGKGCLWPQHPLGLGLCMNHQVIVASHTGAVQPVEPVRRIGHRYA